MRWYSLSKLVALSCVFELCASSSLQQPLGAVPFQFRPARVDDAGDIATVLVDAFSQAPAWKYLNQFEDEYPDYTRRCVEQGMMRLLENDTVDGQTLRVISVPDQTAESAARVVSFSLWQFNRTRPHTSVSALSTLNNALNCSLRLSVNQTRADDYTKHLDSAEKTYLDDIYEHHAYLAVLATHPKWDGHGFAAVHLHWGMGLADRMGMPTTLIATAAGYPLYKSVGFEDIYNDTIERLDGGGIIWHEVMKYSG